MSETSIELCGDPKGDEPAITFTVDGIQLMKFANNGEIYVKGELADDNKKIVQAAWDCFILIREDVFKNLKEEIRKENANTFEFEGFAFEPDPHGDLEKMWFRRTDGEGMQIYKSKLKNVLEKFFTENM